MAKYTLADEAIMRRNGPDNDVRSVKEPSAVYTRIGRQWKLKNGDKTYDNFASLLAERTFGVEDVITDPYEAAIQFFADDTNLDHFSLFGDAAKDHALAIITKVVASKRPKTIYNAW